MFDVKTTKQKIREAIASVDNEIKFPHDIELDSCFCDTEILMSGLSYIPDTDELSITTQHGVFDADEVVVNENDWYFIDDEVSIAVENIKFDRQLKNPKLTTIYAVCLVVRKDKKSEHWDNVFVTPFYKTKEQAMLKYDELVQLSPEERIDLVGCYDAGAFVIVNEKLAE